MFFCVGRAADNIAHQPHIFCFFFLFCFMVGVGFFPLFHLSNAGIGDDLHGLSRDFFGFVIEPFIHITNIEGFALQIGAVDWPHC